MSRSLFFILNRQLSRTYSGLIFKTSQAAYNTSQANTEIFWNHYHAYDKAVEKEGLLIMLLETQSGLQEKKLKV